jgi:hypothetical protein
MTPIPEYRFLLFDSKLRRGAFADCTFCALPAAPAVAAGLPPFPAASEADGWDATWNAVPFIYVGAWPA